MLGVVPGGRKRRKHSSWRCFQIQLEEKSKSFSFITASMSTEDYIMGFFCHGNKSDLSVLFKRHNSGYKGELVLVLKCGGEGLCACDVYAQLPAGHRRGMVTSCPHFKVNKTCKIYKANGK